MLFAEQSWFFLDLMTNTLWTNLMGNWQVDLNFLSDTDLKTVKVL